MMKIENLKFDEKGLIPAVVQDARTKEILTVAYMNLESLHKTVETGETWFFHVLVMNFGIKEKRAEIRKRLFQ